jgi:hypothetical protein
MGGKCKQAKCFLEWAFPSFQNASAFVKEKFLCTLCPLDTIGNFLSVSQDLALSSLAPNYVL